MVIIFYSDINLLFRNAQIVVNKNLWSIGTNLSDVVTHKTKEGSRTLVKMHFFS